MHVFAVHVRRFGPPESHSFEEIATRLEPGPGQVLIEVRAAAVNYPDALVVSGRYQTATPMPFTPGKEGAGVVRSVGAGVTRFRPGDRVLIHVEYGAFADEALAREDQCMPLPDDLGFVDATALGLPAQTAWFALFERASCAAGQVVLVNGATGAVGHAAVQVAAAQGATVLAGVSSPERAQQVLQGIACHTIDLSAPGLRDSLRAQVHAATGGRGADIVVDPLGGDAFDASLRALAWDGRIVTVGFAAGRIPEVKANYLLVKNITATGLQWTDYRDRADQAWKVARAHEGLVQLWRRGALRPLPLRTLPMREFAQALRQVEERRAGGRIVLTTD
jgi:NADPH:quinone reductase